MAVPISWVSGIFWLFSAGKPLSGIIPTKFLALGGGVRFFCGRGGWKCQFYFYGRGDFSDWKSGKDHPTYTYVKDSGHHRFLNLIHFFATFSWISVLADTNTHTWSISWLVKSNSILNTNTEKDYASWCPIFWPFLRRSARAPTIKSARGNVAIQGVFSTIKRAVRSPLRGARSPYGAIRSPYGAIRSPYGPLLIV